MKRQGLAASATAALLTLAGAPVTAAPAFQELPLSGTATTADGYAEPTGCFDGAVWRYQAEGPGTFSRLGRVWFEIQHCTALTGPTSGLFADGTMTVTAANGDQLYMTHSGTFDLVPTDDGLMSYVDLDWVITGGTGRFSGAQGAGTADPVGDIAANTTTAHFTGWITYDASQVSGR